MIKWLLEKIDGRKHVKCGHTTHVIKIDPEILGPEFEACYREILEKIRVRARGDVEPAHVHNRREMAKLGRGRIF